MNGFGAKIKDTLILTSTFSFPASVFLILTRQGKPLRKV